MNMKLAFPAKSAVLQGLFKAAKYGALLLFTVSCGIAVVALPPGLTVRLFAVIAVAAFLLFAWAYPSLPNRTAPYPVLRGVAAVLLVLASVWPQYVFLSVSSLPRVNPFTLVSFLFIAFLLVVFLHYRQFAAQMREALAGIRGMLLIYVIWMIWRLSSSAVADYSAPRILEIIREFIFIHSGFWVALVLTTRQGWRSRLIGLIVLATFIVAAAGVIEALEQRNRFAAFAVADEEGQVGSVLANIASDKLRMGAYRVQSVFGHPILFGQYLGAVFPLLGVALIVKRGILWRLAIATVGALCLIGIWKSGSRSGVLAIIVSTASFLILIWWRTVRFSAVFRGLAIALVPVLIFGAMAGAFFVQDLVLGKSQNEASSTSTRIVQLNAALSASSESPLVGYGQGSATAIAGVVGAGNALTMDIFYVSLLLDSGVVGLVLFLSLFVWVVGGLISQGIGRKDEAGLFACALAAVSVSVLLTLFGVAIPQNLYLVFLSFGALAALSKEKDEPSVGQT